MRYFLLSSLRGKAETIQISPNGDISGLPRRLRLLAMTVAVVFLHSPAHAAQYSVDYAKSTLAFSGTHAGKAFTGVFGAWQATIAFDPQDLAASRIEASIDTASAHTGDKMYDGTLPTGDWFDVKHHPKAHFVSTAITTGAKGGYTATGTLTLRGVAKPVQFDFTLTPADLSAPRIQATATFTLDRLAFGIGADSDAKAEWVGRDITLNLTLSAART